MKLHDISFPFVIADLYNGFGEARGVARLEGQDVALEFEVRESILNIFKGNVKEVRIPLAELSGVEFRKGWLSAKVVLSCLRMRSVANVPGMEQGKVTLTVARADRARAQEFETAINLWMSERALSAVRQPDDDLVLPE